MPKCPKCGNENFDGIDTTSKECVCPIPGCGARIYDPTVTTAHTGLPEAVLSWLRPEKAESVDGLTGDIEG